MAEAAVLASGLRVARGSRDIVRGLELRIEQGQIVGLFGSNGAGKTTLLQALAGLLPTGAGQLQVLGGTASQARRRIGYVAQVVPEGAQTRLRAADFVASAWRAERWGFALSPRLRAERAAAVHEALRSTACEHLAGRGMDTLSGGERQRVCIAQALVNPVRLLLLDEPLANLDPRAQLGVLELVRELRARHGLTVLLSAHDVNALLPVMDRVLYLAAGHGRLGAVDEVIDDAALSALYGVPMAVARHAGYMFIHPAGGFMAEQAAHCEHGAHEHAAHAQES
jgi:zinc/manganese transport system ATP-binding protein